MPSVVDSKLATPCGGYCGECQYYGKTCPGCDIVKGKPFWGECCFYACTQDKKIEHCGLCNDFPCDYFLSKYDPNEGA